MGGKAKARRGAGAGAVSVSCTEFSGGEQGIWHREATHKYVKWTDLCDEVVERGYRSNSPNFFLRLLDLRQQIREPLLASVSFCIKWRIPVLFHRVIVRTHWACGALSTVPGTW